VIARRLALALAVLAAAPPHVARAAPAAGPLAAEGFQAWLERGDAGAAAGRFRAALQQDPADPWANFGQALLAERALDEDGEAAALLAVAARAPGHALAPLALRRLAELGLGSSRLAARIGAGLAPLDEGGTFRGLAAYRARVALANAEEAAGRPDAARRVRARNGLAPIWSVAGPFGAYHALDLDRPFPPEAGAWLARWERPDGPALPSRTLPAPDGGASLDGEPPGGDVWYLAADVRVERGGRYFLAAGTTSSAKAWVDGAPVAERRAWVGWPAAVQVVPVSLGPGSHRVLLKVTRGPARATVAVALAREDGAPSDATWSAAAGPGPAVRPGALPAPLVPARALAEALAREGGPALARLLAARDRLESDRDGAVALMEEAVALLPASPALRAARGDALAGDPSLDDRTASARAEADWREALARDPGDAATRLKLVEAALGGDRVDDAAALVAALPEEAAARPPGKLARARVLGARAFPEAAEALAIDAWRAGGSCGAAAMAYDLASRRDAVALEDEAAAALATCPGGKERLAEHRRHRGDLAGAEAAWQEIARGAPARVDARMALARVRVARGRPAEAVAELEEIERLWPRDPRIPRRLAEVLELAGQASAARAARERALSLDGSDLALRRALALEDGTEVLDDLAADGPRAMRDYEAAGMRPATSSVLVLDAAAVEAYQDGAHTERVHQIFHVLDTKGVERHGEVEIPPGAAVLRLTTWKKDGRVREAEDHGGDKRTLSAAGLEPGDYLEVEWVRGRPARGAAVPGWTADAFFFRSEDTPFFLSTYAVAAPRGTLVVDAHHMPAPAVVEERGRDVTRHEARQVPALVPEPSDPSVAEFLPWMQAGAGAGLEATALAAADGFVGRIRPSREVAELAASIARPPDGTLPRGEALVRAAYEQVMDRVEGGGSLGDQASHVLSRGRGNRTLLLLAVLDALGVPARLALVRPFQADASVHRFPRLDLYAQPVVRVEMDGRVLWLDPTLRWNPFGTLTQSARDAEAIVLPRPGEPLRFERTPADGDGDGYEVDLRVTVDAQGDALVEGTERFGGHDGAATKVALEAVDARQRRQVVEQGLSRSFRALQLEEVSFEGERRRDAPLVIRYRARVPGFASLVGGRMAIEAVPYPARLSARLAPLAARETPLLVPSAERAAMRVVIVPPEGAVPLPGPRREVAGAHGSYQRVERVEGGALVREDRLEVHRARVAPQAYPSLVRFAAEVDEAQAAPMDAGTAPGRTPGG
jgi:tetratricopeptide (TPR) repeat protein